MESNENEWKLYDEKQQVNARVYVGLRGVFFKAEGPILKGEMIEEEEYVAAHVHSKEVFVCIKSVEYVCIWLVYLDQLSVCVWKASGANHRDVVWVSVWM